MAPHHILADEDKWRDLVGGFILAFGDIELFTHYLWQIHCPKKQPPHMLGKRTEQLLVALQDNGESNSIIEPLKEAFGLIGKRNAVAHNPMQVEVFEHSQTGRFVAEHRITSRTPPYIIDDAELTELRAAAEDIITRLYMAIGAPK